MGWRPSCRECACEPACMGCQEGRLERRSRATWAERHSKVKQTSHTCFRCKVSSNGSPCRGTFRFRFGLTCWVPHKAPAPLGQQASSLLQGGIRRTPESKEQSPLPCLRRTPRKGETPVQQEGVALGTIWDPLTWGTPSDGDNNAGRLGFAGTPCSPPPGVPCAPNIFPRVATTAKWLVAEINRRNSNRMLSWRKNAPCPGGAKRAQRCCKRLAWHAHPVGARHIHDACGDAPV